MHNHDHDHSHPPHTPASQDEGRLAIAAGVTGVFMVIEAVGGVLSGSLALIADAGHMLTDFGSLILALVALRLSRRPANNQLTYGFDRLSILAAFVNGLALFVIAAWIVFEAIQRLTTPQEVMGGLMMWIGVAGLGVNVIAFIVLTRGGTNNLNMRAAALHVAGDVLGSVGAIVAAGIIMMTGWMPIDPILSIIVTLIILRSAWVIVAQSGHILLEGAPVDVDRDELEQRLMSDIAGIKAIDHVHIWSVTQERKMITLEVQLDAGYDPLDARNQIKDLLTQRFGLSHSAVEIR